MHFDANSLVLLLSSDLTSGLLLVTEYSYSVVLLLLLKYLNNSFTTGSNSSSSIYDDSFLVDVHIAMNGGYSSVQRLYPSITF